MADDELESKEQQNVTDEKISSKSKDDENDMFDFLYDINKRNILRRHKIGDVCTFSSWLKALKLSTNNKIRNEYMQLMILALEFPKPVCPFKDPPPAIIDPLEHGVIETSRNFGYGEGTASCTPTNTYVSNPPITTSVTHDKCRFASSQIIPNVGAQVYYAYSDEPLYKWHIPPEISVPKRGPHAGPLEWERAITGMVPVNKPLVENALINMEEKDKDELASGIGGKMSEKKSDMVKEKGKPDICNVMNIEQQNRNVTENFKWNDASILTGEKIIGAEMCSDNKMDGQLKSQIELDEEAASAYDKLYPGDFKILVDYSIVDGIVPASKLISMEVGDKRFSKSQQPDLKLTREQIALCDEKCSSKPQKCSPTRDLCGDMNNMSNALRQNAGQESTWLRVDCGPKITAEAKNRRRKISELSTYLTNLTAESQKFKTRKNVGDECSKTDIGSSEDEFSQRCVASSTELDDKPENSSGEKCVLQKNFLSIQSVADCIEESLNDAARSLPQDGGTESENTDQDRKSLDEPL